MTNQPSVGTSWRASGLADVDSRNSLRGGLAAVLIRNNRGAATNISPFAVGSPPTVAWSPFAADGQPRADLFAAIRVGGIWIPNPDPNEGFWSVGAMKEDGGPERAPSVKEDNQMILQSNFPFDTDLTEEGIVVSFTGVETLKPMMKRIRMNLPLCDSNGNSIVEDPGVENFSLGKPVDVDSQDWQIILMFARRKQGAFVYTAEGYSLAKLTNIGNFKRSKTDPDAGELGFTVLPDPFFVGKDPSDPTSDELIPIFYNEWVTGDAWVAQGGLPVFPSAPTALAVGATGATLTFAEVTGTAGPVGYTFEKSVSPYSVWTAVTASAVAADTPTDGSVQATLTGLVTATTYKLRAVALAENGTTATSQNSATITTS